MSGLWFLAGVYGFFVVLGVALWFVAVAEGRDPTRSVEFSPREARLALGGILGWPLVVVVFVAQAFFRLLTWLTSDLRPKPSPKPDAGYRDSAKGGDA